MKNKLFIFNFVEDILFFSPLVGNKLFLKKKTSPPEYQIVRPLTETKCECIGRYSSMKKGAEIYKNTIPEREGHNIPKEIF